jgi:hypothetical protein
MRIKSVGQCARGQVTYFHSMGARLTRPAALCECGVGEKIWSKLHSLSQTHSNLHHAYNLKSFGRAREWF